MKLDICFCSKRKNILVRYKNTYLIITKKLKLIRIFNKNILYTNKISFKFLNLFNNKSKNLKDISIKLILNIYFKEKSL